MDLNPQPQLPGLTLPEPSRALIVLKARNEGLARQVTLERAHAQPTEREPVCLAEALQLGYVANIFTHVSLPYRAPMVRGEDGQKREADVWIRRSPYGTLFIQSGVRLVDAPNADRHGQPQKIAKPIGIPWGSFPRLLLAWLTTEVVTKRSPEIDLGKNVREFFDKLGIPCTTGKRGTVTAVREQLDRLLSARINVTDDQQPGREGQMLLADGQQRGTHLWWQAHKPIASLWQPRILLSNVFFEVLRQRAVPIDMRALRVVLQSPLAMDLLVWLSYRSETLPAAEAAPLIVPWRALYYQCGSESNLNKFQENVRRAMRLVHAVYPAARVVVPVRRGLEMRRFASTVPRLRATS